MDLSVKTPPVLTSITRDLVKANKRITHAAEDDLIDFWVKAADAYIEKKCNIALMEQTLVLKITRVLPVISLPRPPLVSITHLKYTKTDQSEVTVAPVDYIQTSNNMLVVIEIPEITSETSGTMEIEYIAGRESQDDVPADIGQAALLLASHYVTSREAAYLDPRLMHVEKRISFGVDALLEQNRIPNINEMLNGGY